MFCLPARLTSSEGAEQLFGSDAAFQGQQCEARFSSGAGRGPTRADSELKTLLQRKKKREKKHSPYCN